MLTIVYENVNTIYYYDILTFVKTNSGSILRCAHREKMYVHCGCCVLEV